MSAPYSAFPDSEFQSRFATARQLLDSKGLAACLMMAPENQYYFGGYDSWVSVNSPEALIFTPGEDAPTILLRDVDVPLAEETSWVTDVRDYNLVTERFAERACEILAEKGVSEGTVAVELSSYAVPALLGDQLREGNPKITFVDGTSLFGEPRLEKSAAEISYMEEAGRYANLGLDAMRGRAASGVTEIALASAIETAMRDAGCDYWAVPIELTSGERSAGGHGTPRARVIASGDLVHAEFAGVANRYHATAIQTLACGEPSSQARELYDIALASLEAGLAATTCGADVAAVEEASLVPLRHHGLEHAAKMRFGYGIGIAYPPIWLEPLTIARGFDDTLRPGMTFVLHSCLQLPEENLGVIQGGTWIMEETGLRMLAGAGACPLVVL